MYGYRVLTTAPGGVTLARFDGGTPALVEAVVGKGRVLAWATSLDLSWNDMALKPVYCHSCTSWSVRPRAIASSPAG